MDVSISYSHILYSIIFISIMNFIFYYGTIVSYMNSGFLFITYFSLDLEMSRFFACSGHIQKPTNSDIDEFHFQQIFTECQLCAGHLLDSWDSTVNTDLHGAYILVRRDRW